MPVLFATWKKLITLPRFALVALAPSAARPTVVSRATARGPGAAAITSAPTGARRRSHPLPTQRGGDVGDLEACRVVGELAPRHERAEHELAHLPRVERRIGARDRQGGELLRICTVL